MKVNIQKEINLFKKEINNNLKRIHINSQSKSMKREGIKSLSNSLNKDIEKLFKKYKEIKKERLIKEKSQQLLVNRLKYLRNEVKRSVSKKAQKKTKEEIDDKNRIICVKKNSKYTNYGISKKYQESNKQSPKDIINDNESLGKKSFNGNESQIMNSSYKSLNSNKQKNYNSSNSEKENRNEINNYLNNNKHCAYNIDDFLKKKNKYNIGNKNSNNNIYIIINNQNNCLEEKPNNKNNIEINNEYD